MFSATLGVWLPSQHACEFADTVLFGYFCNGRYNSPSVICFVNHKVLVCEGGDLW